jgi:hypothetical protein
VYREPLSGLEETLSALVEHRCKRIGVGSRLAARLSVHGQRLSVFVEPRCKRFDVGEPLASRLSVRGERLSAFEEHRCKRFDDGKPLAARLSVCGGRLSGLEERLSAFEEHRCKRFDDGEPLTSGLSVFGGRLSGLEGRLLVFGGPRWERCHDGELLAAGRLLSGERFSAIEERPLAAPLCSAQFPGERLDRFGVPRCLVVVEERVRADLFVRRERLQYELADTLILDAEMREDLAPGVDRAQVPLAVRHERERRRQNLGKRAKLWCAPRSKGSLQGRATRM